MPICVKCGAEKDDGAFYAKDRKCKTCRTEMVRSNRAANLDRYRAYDRGRAMLPHRAGARSAYRATDSGKNAVRRAHKKHHLLYAARRAARIELNNALRDGKITRPEACWFCGGRDRVQGHHADYDNPLGVTWLCQACHRRVHRETEQYKRQEIIA